MEPVTVAVTRVVHPGKQAEFARWADEIDHAVSQSAGHLGSVRLHDAQGVNQLVYHFDTPAHLHAWETSAARRELLEQGDRLSDERRTTTAGTDPWFNVSGAAAPPAWKTFLITWAAVYPLLLVIAAALTAIAPGLPRTLQLAVTSIVLTATLTWIVLPRVRAQLRPWLLHGARPVPTGGQSRSRDPDATRCVTPTTTGFASREPRR
jgi:uncharacterized protein